MLLVDVEDNLMRNSFDRVLNELDFGIKAEDELRHANCINSMEELLLAKADLAYGKLHCLDAYNQLRLYFVTEWVGEFGLRNCMRHFEAKAFNNYFQDKIKRLVQGTISISPFRFEDHLPPYNPEVPAIVNVLASVNRGFGGRIDGDFDV
jgi:hypothetical protein